jgi:nucleoid-associated protein YgaU
MVGRVARNLLTLRDIAAFTVSGLAVAGAALVSYRVLGPHQTPPAYVSPSEQVPDPQSLAKKDPSGTYASAEAATQPSFDVVRIEPNGDAVLAGRAPPGAAIMVLRNGTPYAEGRADGSGAFALVLPQLPVGASEILLQSTGADGSPVRSGRTVTAVIAQDRATRPLVALASPNEPTDVLSAGGEPAAGSRESGTKEVAKTGVRIASIDVQAGGRMFVSGQAAPDAKVRLFLNDSPVAEGQASHDGRVTFDVRRGAQPGDYRVRLDELDPHSGSTKSQAEADLAVPAAAADTRSSHVDHTGAVIVPQIRTTVVSQGDNLWSISRKAYGRGLSYTLIFGANRQAIRDPNRIYPKQVFVIPGPAVQ